VKELTVALPNEEILTRLSPAPEGVRFVVWDVGDAPLDRPIDLLVLRYMIPAAELKELAGVAVAVVQSQTLGFDAVAENLPAGLTYCNAVDVHEASTAELALALILASLRGIPTAVESARDGLWAHTRWPGLAGREILLIGVGGVGREIEARLNPFDVTLVKVAHTAREGVHGLDELPELLPTADVVILAVPLNDSTRRLVDGAFVERMKRGALVVNVSRGAVVDTEALTASVAVGHVHAALDVTDPEPLPSEHALWRLPGVIITPHVGGHTGAMAGRVDTLVREQIRRAQLGLAPMNVVLHS
jgi:phosphoglycerate dehydrogenase-like enzyme